MTAFTPLGTALERFSRLRGRDAAPSDPGLLPDPADASDFEPRYLGWELARWAVGLSGEERRALAALASAFIAAMQSGSTRLPIGEGALEGALARVGAADAAPSVRSLLASWANAGQGKEALVAVLGRAGDRAPLIVEGPWLYSERMRILEERFSRRVRARVSRSSPGVGGAKAIHRALGAVAPGPPPLTEEQRTAVGAALSGSLAMVTGGPGTGKTTIVVALLRALAWMGVPMDSVALAAPTGKAAQRLREAIALALASPTSDLAQAGLRAEPPAPQTLHRLLGWSPSAGRFARHENDPLAHRVVVVDEASMIDLAMMDRLLRALRDEARLVLIGDADQLPSVEAGAVFRDMCAALGAARLTENLRVAKDPAARQIVAAARCVNAGQFDASFTDSVVTRRDVLELTFEGVEHLDATWQDVGPAFVERWWQERVSSLDELERLVTRTYRLRGGAFGDDDAADLRKLFDHYARMRILCATRVRGFAAGAQAMNDRLVECLRGLGAAPGRRPRGSSGRACAGAPLLVGRNDYERQLFNGDQGLVVRVEGGDGTDRAARADGGAGHGAAHLAAVFPRDHGFATVPLDALSDWAPAFAMTVHKAQGSEFDHVALVLPEDDMPLLTRELVYTAITRARRSTLLVGPRSLLARAVSRTTERHSGVAERLTPLED